MLSPTSRSSPIFAKPASRGADVSFLADISQEPSPASNGVLNLTGFAATPVSYIIFSAPGIRNGENHEFSVASLEVSTVRVPEPGTLLLLGAGLLVMGVFGRKRLFGETRAQS